MSYTADFAETTRGRVDLLPNGAYAGGKFPRTLRVGLVTLGAWPACGRSPLSAGSDILGAARVSLCPFRCIPTLSRTEAPA